MDIALIIRFPAVFSTFDEYASEVESGHLSWSPTHESEEFWKENVEKIRFEKNGKVVK
jgi:V-type H+-transporting ATPase subunit H